MSNGERDVCERSAEVVDAQMLIRTASKEMLENKKLQHLPFFFVGGGGAAFFFPAGGGGAVGSV